MTSTLLIMHYWNASGCTGIVLCHPLSTNALNILCEGFKEPYLWIMIISLNSEHIRQKTKDKQEKGNEVEETGSFSNAPKSLVIKFTKLVSKLDHEHV